MTTTTTRPQPSRPPIINLAIAGQITQMLADMGLMLVSAPLKGRPRLLGVSADKRTAVEVIGELASMRAITVLASISPDDLDASRRNGELMRLVLDLVAPLWPSRGRWLVEALRAFGRVHEKVQQHPERYTMRPATATLGYGEITLTYLHKTNQLSLQIRLKGGFHAALAAA